MVAKVAVTSLEWREKGKPKGALQKSMLSFCNRLNNRGEGKERTNGETSVAGGKQDSNEVNGKEGHLMILLLQILTVGLFIYFLAMLHGIVGS